MPCPSFRNGIAPSVMATGSMVRASESARSTIRVGLLRFSFKETALEDAEFNEHSYGVGENAQTSGDDWMTCKVEQKVFKGFGGPFKLEEMIRAFLDWASRNGEQLSSPDGQ